MNEPNGGYATGTLFDVEYEGSTITVRVKGDDGHEYATEYVRGGIWGAAPFETLYVAHRPDEPTYYAVGHNMPGYLPESDVWVTDDHDAAKRSLIDDMERDADHYCDVAASIVDDDPTEAERLRTLADEISAAQQDLNLISAGSEWGEIIGNVSYWLNVTEEAPSDDDF